jgi:adenylate cyclase
VNRFGTREFGVRFVFGEHFLDTDRRELHRDGEPVSLEPQVFDFLVYLVRNRDRVVTKDDLLTAIWGGRIVSESTLTSRINAVRKAVGDSGEAQRVVRTIARKGLRFIAEVREARDAGNEPGGEPIAAARPAPTAEPAAALPDRPSVAVLPFTNMSGDVEQEYFADGIVEDIITALSRYPSLLVVARNSTFAYKGRAYDIRQVGRALGVGYVLEGSVRAAGGRIRVTAQLIEADTSNHLWADRYQRDLADVFAVQDEITESVVTAIAPAITAAERQRALRRAPASLDAWSACQRGSWHLTLLDAENNAMAERFFRQAIALDPTLAAGYLGLSRTLNAAATTLYTRDLQETQRECEALVRKAIGLDPTSAEAHSSLSWALLQIPDYEGALAEAEHALRLSPNLAGAHGTRGQALIFSGHVREGLVSLETAIRLDPGHPTVSMRMFQIQVGLFFAKDYEASIEAAHRALRHNPTSSQIYRYLAAAFGQLDRLDEAKHALSKAMELAPGSFDVYVRRRVSWLRPEDWGLMIEGLHKAGWQG